MLRVLTIIAAIAIIIIGAITFPLPIPIGLILIAVGIAMLIGASKIVRVMIKKLRRRYQKFDRIMCRAQTLAPDIIGKILRRTDPYKKNRSTNTDINTH